MQNLFIVPIEPIETRYTKHWYQFVPTLFAKNCPNFNVKTVEVLFSTCENTPGAFLNFTATIDFKSRQSALIAEMFSRGEVKSGDVFLYMDYWNPTVNNTKYMAELMGIDVKIIGIAHAGYWDPADLLPNKSKDKRWGWTMEETFAKAYDKILFATPFSERLYSWSIHKASTLSTGFPMEYYDEVFTPYWELENAPPKENIVVFPHRKSPEKNLNLFYALAERLPSYKFIVAMDVCETKFEYHNLLYRSKLAFSASMQETLGISIGIEAPRAGCEVLVPKRLSYEVMHFDGSFYPSEVAYGYEPEMKPSNVEYLADLITEKMTTFNIYNAKKIHDANLRDFFTGTKMYEFLNGLTRNR